MSVPASPSRTSGHAAEVTPDLACFALSIVNVYFYGPKNAGDRRWVLIDAGLAGSAPKIAKAAAERFGANARPSAIILTHGHFDHVGALHDLAALYDAPVYAHPWELPYLTGQSDYPPPDPSVGGGAMSLLSRLYPRSPIDIRDRVRPLPPDGSVPGMPGWHWVHTPGHAPGHVALFREADRTVIAGDAFVTQRQESLLGVLTRIPSVRRPPAYFTCDWGAAKRSVAALAKLRPNLALTGHGLPVGGGELTQGLNTLVANWERDAVPSHGRYIRTPAGVTRTGVKSVPPPVLDTQLLALAGVAAGVAAATMIGARSRSA